MKKLTIVLTLAAFSLVPALQAGDGCCPASKQAAGTCPASKEKAEAKGCCPKEGAKAPAKAKVDTNKGASGLVKK